MNRVVSPNDPHNKPELLCPNLTPIYEVYANPWFRVYDRASYYTLEYDRPQVVILPIVDKDNILMVRVRRPVINDTPLELPAGDSREEETPIQAARRELFEETGIYIDLLERFNSVNPISEMPGRIPVLLSVFQVEITFDEYFLKKDFDKNEIVSVELFSIEAIREKITNGGIYLSSPIAILSRFIFNFSWNKNE